MLTTQARCTQIKLFRLPADNNGSPLNIGQPAAPGVLLGMANPMAEMCSFATDIAFCSQIANSLYPNRS
jgi:hypothetical protein